MRTSSSVLASVLLLALPLSACGNPGSGSDSDSDVIAESQAARSQSSAAQSSSAEATTEPTTDKEIATSDPQPLGTKCGDIVDAKGEKLVVVAVKDGTSCTAGQHVMEEYKAADYGAEADRFYNWTSEEGWHCSMDWLFDHEMDTGTLGRMTCQDADLVDPSADADGSEATSTRDNAARFGEPRHQVVAMYADEVSKVTGELPY